MVEGMGRGNGLFSSAYCNINKIARVREKRMRLPHPTYFIQFKFSIITKTHVFCRTMEIATSLPFRPMLGLG